MMALVAAILVAGGGLLFAVTAGRLAQFLLDRKDYAMASAANNDLAAAISDLLAENAALKAQLAEPGADAALAEETAAEDALTAQIRAVVPSLAAS